MLIDNTAIKLDIFSLYGAALWMTPAALMRHVEYYRRDFRHREALH
jgi:hypothetical protein